MEIKNFLDRVSLKYIINPLDEQETREMIRFRLAQSGFNSGAILFTEEAIKLIHSHTQGYPRKITTLCHNALESIVMQQRDLIDREVIQTFIEEDKKAAEDARQYHS